MTTHPNMAATPNVAATSNMATSPHMEASPDVATAFDQSPRTAQPSHNATNNNQFITSIAYFDNVHNINSLIDGTSPHPLPYALASDYG